MELIAVRHSRCQRSFFLAHHSQKVAATWRASVSSVLASDSKQHLEMKGKKGGGSRRRGARRGEDRQDRTAMARMVETSRPPQASSSCLIPSVLRVLRVSASILLRATCVRGVF